MIEEMIKRLMEQLYSGTSSISYKGIYFQVKDLEYASPIDSKYSKYIYIDIPKSLGLETDYVSVAYEKTKSSRKTACFRLATYFVKEILPKIDFKLKNIMHNEEIDKILEVLD